MTEIEKTKKLDSIKELRSQGLQKLAVNKTILEKEKEIDNIKREAEGGRLSRISGYFFGPSESEKKKQELEHQKKLDLAQQELEKIKKEAPDALILQKRSSSNFDEKNWEKIKFYFVIKKGGFHLCHEKKALLKASFEKFEVSGKMKESCLMLDLQLNSFLIIDKLEDSKYFPYIFEARDFKVVFVQNPMEISISSGDIYVYAILSSIMNIANIFQNAALANVDISDYVSKANNQFNKYVEDGQGYLKNVITETGVAAAMKIELDLTAPKVIIPTSLKEEAPYMIINLGRLTCKTSTIKIQALDYENYNFNVTDLESFIV